VSSGIDRHSQQTARTSGVGERLTRSHCLHTHRRMRIAESQWQSCRTHLAEAHERREGLADAPSDSRHVDEPRKARGSILRLPLDEQTLHGVPLPAIRMIHRGSRGH
jgi:hypothetical protein